MTPKFMSRTVLALAISAAAGYSFAVPVEPPAPPVSFGAETVDGFTLTGTASVAEDIVDLEGTTVNGDINLDGDFTATGDYVSGVDMDGLGSAAMVMNGNVTNYGHLNLNGLAATGILADQIALNGSIINNGQIIVAGDYDSANSEAAGGVVILGTAALGDIRNDGVISVTGDQGDGYRLSSAELQGFLINSRDAEISVSGAGASGISAFDSDVEVTINHGRITADGASASGVDYDQTSFNRLVNSGSITATGESSAGIMLDNINLVYDNELGESQQGIINSGTISGDQYGIVVDGLLQGDSAPLYIHMNSGAITGGTAAIKGNDQDVRLEWNFGEINGDLLDIGDINVNSFGVFGGSTISGNGNRTLTVKSDAFLTLNAPHTTITDNFTMQDNSVLKLPVSALTNPASPILAVGGTATLGNNAEIMLTPKPENFAPQSAGADYVIIGAGELINNGVVVSSTSDLMELKSFNTADNQLVAQLALKSDDEIDDVIEDDNDDEDIGDDNSEEAISPLIHMLSFMDENDPIFQAMVNATPAERAELAKQLTPTINGGSTQAAISGQALVSDAVGGRTGSLRSGESSGEMLAETGAWVQILTNKMSQDRRSGVEGYDADTNGFSIGADGKANELVTLGVAYSYLESDVKSDGGNKTDVEGHSFTAYAGLEQGNWFADSAITYSVNDNSSTRYIVGTEAKADYDSTMLGLSAEGGYTFKVSPNAAVEPLAGLRYAAIDIESYDEKGSSAALSVGSQRYEIVEAGLGMRVKGDFLVGNGVLKPQAKLMAYHDFAADQASTTSSFILGSTSFTTNGAKPARDSYELGLGASYELGNVTLGANYSRLTKSGFESDTFTANARYDF
ncbi:autotransporter domain-containing protein [Pseudomonas aeruginosa]|uniref:autotransporter family protein n=1 Tax=Pseudomonas aeruginosa TaxID=287 RepID=UPI000FC42EA8|nr:autotransporter outer membrane beta-barrel domain-containing protein [Pseudomonas aeruginosa]RUE86321.1 autotransporter domain-containing protein [Pseudomonas aeruginosa]